MKISCYACGDLRKGIESICTKCGNPFRIRPDFRYRDNIEKNFPYLERFVSLGESTTPVTRYSGMDFKLDYFQPTFSYKDRGSRVLVSYLQENRGQVGKIISEDSSGNAGASITAYGKRAGFSVNVYIPNDAAGTKIELIKAYGASIHRIPGSREEVRKAAMSDSGFYVGHSVYPEFRDGIRSLAYELFTQYQGNIPDNIYIPTSAGTLLIGLYEGLNHLLESGEIARIPRLIACQPDLMSPLKAALAGKIYVGSGKKSLADALITEKSPLLSPLIEILREFGGTISVSEDDIIAARNELAGAGIYTEYSSAVAFAAARSVHEESSLILLTGNGLKNIPQISA